MVTRSTKITMGAAVAVTGVLLASCSGAISSGTDTASTTTSSSCSAKIKSDLAAADGPGTLTVGPKVDAAGLTGKSVWIIGIDNAQQVIADVQSGVDAAGKAAGLKITNFDARGSAAEAGKGVSEAVAADASAIIIDAVNTDDIGGALAQAKTKGIPVISAYEDSKTPGYLYTVVGPQNKTAGSYQGLAALSLTNCKPNALYVNSPVFSAQQEFAQGSKAEIAKVCGRSCTATTITYEPANLSTQVHSNVQNALQRDPNIDVVIAGTDDVAIVAVPAIQQLKSKAVVIGESGVAANLKLLQQKQVELADVANPPSQVTGWMLVDESIRAMLHQQPAPQDFIRSRLITPQNVGDGGIQTLFPAFSDYQSRFTADWSIAAGQ